MSAGIAASPMIVRATSADAPSGVWNAAHCNAGAVVQISIGANTQGLLTRGQQIRVRGFVEERNGPRIEASRPEQIEIAEAERN